MEKHCIEFLSALEGYHQMLKTIHWHTTNKSEHLLTDEIDGDVLEFEDSMAEVLMGKYGERFKIGELKSLLPNSRETKELLKELQKDVKDFRKHYSSGNDEDYGVCNIIDDFLSKVHTWQYLETLS